MIENLQTGYVKIYRSWIASGIWSMPWAWERVAKCCILLANHKPNKYWDGKENIKVPSGTFITSDRTLAEAAKVTRKQARAALDALQSDKFIRIKRDQRKTVVTVCNWGVYQGAFDAEGPVEKSNRDQQNTDLRDQQQGKVDATKQTSSRHATGIEGPPKGTSKGPPRDHQKGPVRDHQKMSATFSEQITYEPQNFDEEPPKGTTEGPKQEEEKNKSRSDLLSAPSDLLSDRDICAFALTECTSTGSSNSWKSEFFEHRFWPKVWMKRGKGAAEKAFRKAATGQGRAEYLLEKAIEQGPLIMADAKKRKSTPLHVSSWLNGRRYEDDWGEAEDTGEDLY